jgi:hypothetical protein
MFSPMPICSMSPCIAEARFDSESSR